MKDILKESQKLFVDLIDKIESYIPKENNLELVILKGHILLEYLMDKIIELLSNATFDISKTNFRFIDKVTIIKILGITPDTIGTYEMLIKYNSVRNDIAHKLSYDRNKVDELIRLVGQKSFSKKVTLKIDSDITRAKALKAYIPIIMGQLLAAFHIKTDLKKLSDLIDKTFLNNDKE